MAVKLANLKIKAFILGLMICPILANAQEAENLFHKEYSKLSFVLQPSILVKSNAHNYDGSTYPSVKFTNDFSYQFGVYYNFAQSGSFNFKTGVIAKEFIPKFDLNISDDDIGIGEESILTQFDPYNQFIISVPLKTECFLKVSKKLNVSLGAGLNFNFITGTNTPTVTTVSVSNSRGFSKEIFYSTSDSQNNFNVSYDLSIGANYKAGFALLDLSFFVNNSLGTNYLEGKYEIYNLTQSSDKSGSYVIKSNFYGISLTISPKKGWLKSDW